MSVLIARIGKPHSLHGEVTVQLHTDDPVGRFVPGAEFTTEAVAGSGVVKLVDFGEIPDRTGAESLRGTRLLAQESDEASDDDGWYEEELAGLSVVDPAGVVLGEVVGLDVGAAQDRLRIRLTDGVEALVPFVEALVPEVDIAGGRVGVDAPPGLLDLARES